MHVKKRSLIDAVVAGTANALVFASEAAELELPWVLYWSVTGAFFFLFSRDRVDRDLKWVLFVGGLLLYLLPYFGALLRGQDISLGFYSLYLFVVCLFFQFGSVPNYGRSVSLKGRWLYPLLVAALLAFAGQYIWLPMYAAFFSIALLFFDRLAADRRNSRAYVLGCMALLYAVMAYHMIFMWSGFGRLYQLTYLLIPLLIMARHEVLKIKQWHFLLLAPIGMVAGEFIRGVSALSRSTFAGGSSAHHLFLMDELRSEQTSDAFGFAELLEQLSLYFLNWFPRSIWTTKPEGIGSWFVDEHLGRKGFGEEFSVSLGLWGEHIYLNPEFWILSGTVVILLTILVSRALYRAMGFSYPVLLVFRANLLTLFWGGMASFGSRVWWMVLPMVGYLLIESLLNGRFGRQSGSTKILADRRF